MKIMTVCLSFNQKKMATCPDLCKGQCKKVGINVVVIVVVTNNTALSQSSDVA